MKTKTIIILHIIAQALAQTAIIAILPEAIKPYCQAIAVIIGLIISALDPTATLEKLGLSKREYLGRISKKNNEILSA